MKYNKKLILAFIVLTIILVSIISFGGIYVQKQNRMENILPEYLLGRDLKGYRRIELKVSDETKKINYNAEGKEISSSDTETEVAKTEEKKVNSDEVLTVENYKEAKQIIEKRLKAMKLNDYTIKQNEENGGIILEIPEDASTDTIVGQLSLQGKFEIVDDETDEILMTNEDLKQVKSGYGQTSTGATAIFINIEFNKEGTEKFKNITNTYRETTVAKTEENANETANEPVEEEETETITKKIAIKIDGATMLTTYFEEEISNGILQLSVGSSKNSTSEQLQENLREAGNIATLLNSGNMKIVYEMEQNKFIYSPITQEEIKIGAIIVIAIIAVGMIYLIIKYKLKGILASISLIGYSALLLLALRFFNVEISIGGLISIVFSILLSYIILNSMLKQKDNLKVIKQYTLMCIPTLVIAIAFTFANISMGAVLFWGISISLLYNLSVSSIMLK